MNKLVKLDVDDNVKAQRRIQEKRVQKHVEPLDAIPAKGAKNSSKAAARATSSLCGRCLNNGIILDLVKGDPVVVKFLESIED
jgi:hypothetical protein